MNTDEREDTRIYKVVLNHEEQYSIWPADRENPLGWFDEGTSGLKAECLSRIKEVWTDMRPLSLRKRMEEAKQIEEAKKAETAEGNGKAAEGNGNVTAVAAADKPAKSKESKSRKKGADAAAAPKRKRAAAPKAEGTAA